MSEPIRKPPTARRSAWFTFGLVSVAIIVIIIAANSVYTNPVFRLVSVRDSTAIAR